jgi:hypothetical protein
MIAKVPGKNLEQQTKRLSTECVGESINRLPLGRIVAAAKCDLFLFAGINARMRRSFTAHSDAAPGSPYYYIVPDGNEPGSTSGSDPGRSAMPASVAG